MQPAFLVRFPAAGPWRIGPDSGARDRVESLLHSDALYSAICAAMGQLGLLEGWLDAIFRRPEGPALRLSSCFPFQDDTHYVVPPRSLWPPAPSGKIRWKGARFVPLQVVEALLAGRHPGEDRWRVDGPSRCLVPAERDEGPFRTATRSSAAVDRLSGNVEAHRTTCLEFSSGAGMWALGLWADESAKEQWDASARAALRLLADSGFGGRRSLGWGRSLEPEFRDGALPGLIFDSAPGLQAGSDAEPPAAPETAYWMLSLFNPGESDTVDCGRGSYSLLTRGGYAAPGGVKKLSRMVAEGSVIFAGAPTAGAAQDAAPEGAGHPVYRAGFAFALPMPWR